MNNTYKGKYINVELLKDDFVVTRHNYNPSIQWDDIASELQGILTDLITNPPQFKKECYNISIEKLDKRIGDFIDV